MSTLSEASLVKPAQFDKRPVCCRNAAISYHNRGEIEIPLCVVEGDFEEIFVLMERSVTMLITLSVP